MRKHKQMKNIAIIGASSGIGLALTHMLEKDHVIYAFSRNRGELPESEHIIWQELDVTGGLNFGELPEKLDGLVFCPGSITLKPVRGLKAEQIHQDFELNALAAFKTVQALYKPLLASGSASVVMFSTVAVSQGMPYHASVAMAKGAVEGLVRSLAAELAPKVRVNAIAPSLTDTQLAERLLGTEERREASAERHPMKRVGKPDDIAGMAKYLLSDDASWITGQILHVDGGMSTLNTG